ncbi:hypothetical protein [Saccharothrix sp. NRRL B-16314]|uniref:hypothetical protein n=1 Tax=Saccharothrix sp. NRRL B-16314 TaxID=1463825 RepID=UPI000526BCB7|nr:hypothetical protein [Saccharothrix sp. NRRL B-16314]
MSWELIERWSWVAGIFSAFVAAVSAWAAARAAKGTVRDLALVLSLATDKPELLAKVEADARKRAEAVRQRMRTAVVSTASAFVLIATGGVFGLLAAQLPVHVSAEVVGGDAPRTEQECTKAAEASICAPVHVYELAAGTTVETRFAVTHQPVAQRGAGGLTVELPDCEAEVRWRVSVGGAVVAEAVSRDDMVRAEFPVAGDQEYTFTAERPADGGCPTTELRVRTGVSFDR